MAFDCRVRARYGCCMARLKRCFPRVLDTISPMNASQENLWSAPFAGKPLDATVVVPGSKSLSNRYLILAALGHRPVRLVGLLRSRDTELMMDALRSLGVCCEIDEQVDTTVTVVPPSDGRFHGGTTVSYTHLDVYKRQEFVRWLLNLIVQYEGMLLAEFLQLVWRDERVIRVDDLVIGFVPPGCGLSGGPGLDG